MKRITKKWNREGKRPVVLLDFDDVLFDFLGTVNKKYNTITNQGVKLDDYKSWDLSEVGDVHVYMNIIKDPNLWSNGICSTFNKRRKMECSYLYSLYNS